MYYFDPFQQCQQLRDAASKLHEKASDVLDAIQEAAKNHVTNAKDVLKFVQEKLVAKAVNFKCEDALSAEVTWREMSLFYLSIPHFDTKYILDPSNFGSFLFI